MMFRSFRDGPEVCPRAQVNRPPSPAEVGTLPALELSEKEQKVYDALGKAELSIDDVIRQLPGKMFVHHT